MKTKLIAIILLILISASVNAQSGADNGFIITNEGDSTIVMFQIQSSIKNYSSCQVIVEGVTKEYFPKDIKGYVFDDFHYVSGIVEDQFVRALTIGEMSLYQHKEVFYVVKGNEKPQILEHTIFKQDGTKYYDVKWKRIVNFLISDCDRLKNEIEKLDYNDQSLTKIISDYNKCKNGSSIIYTYDWKKKYQIQFDIIPIVGVVQSQIKTTSGQDFHQPYVGTMTSISPSLAINLGLSFPNLNGAKILTGLQYNQVNFNHVHHQTISFSNVTHLETRAWHISYNELTIPLILQNNLFKWKSNILFAQIGIESSHFLHLKQEIKFQRISTYTDNTVTEINTSPNPLERTFLLKDTQVAAIAGVGIEKKLGRNYYGLVLKYSMYPGIGLDKEYYEGQNSKVLNTLMSKISIQTQIRL